MPVVVYWCFNALVVHGWRIASCVCAAGYVAGRPAWMPALLTGRGSCRKCHGPARVGVNAASLHRAHLVGRIDLSFVRLMPSSARAHSGRLSHSCCQRELAFTSASKTRRITPNTRRSQYSWIVPSFWIPQAQSSSPVSRVGSATHRFSAATKAISGSPAVIWVTRYYGIRIRVARGGGSRTHPTLLEQPGHAIAGPALKQP
jgi:hypothetical protein